jgi:N-acyl homoserine lactone hydrolase
VVVDVDQMRVRVGLAVGDQENLAMAIEAITKPVGYVARRVIPVHEERLKDRFPSRITADGLRISEVCLADGEKSRVR